MISKLSHLIAVHVTAETHRSPNIQVRSKPRHLRALHFTTKTPISPKM